MYSAIRMYKGNKMGDLEKDLNKILSEKLISIVE